MKRLPKEHLATHLRVKNLKTGESGWVPVFGIAADAEGNVYVDPEYSYKTTQPHSGSIRVTRTEDGLVVSIPKARLPLTAWGNPPHGWDIAVQVEIHEDVAP